MYLENSIFKDWNILKWVFNILILVLTISILGLFVNVVFAIGYIVMLVVHEMGHVMAAKGYDIQVRFGGFTPFGAYIQILDQTSLKENAIIALSGPLCGLITTVLYFFLYYIVGEPTFLWLSFFTGIVSLMNLLPLDPFDGGKVIEGTFCYLPILFIPFLGYGVYRSYLENTPFGILAVLAILYILRDVKQMRKRNRIDRLLYLEKPPKLSIFLVYLLIIGLLSAMLVALYLDYGFALLPKFQPVQIPSELQALWTQLLP